MSKLASLAEAAALVRDGDTLALGGMTLYRRPVAFVRALLQQESPPRDLTLLCFTAGFESDLLVGAGLVERVRTCYFGLESFGLAPMFTQAATAGTLAVVEETEASLAFGLRATLARVGFMPGRGWLGTDLVKDVDRLIRAYDDGAGVTAAFNRNVLAVLDRELKADFDLDTFDHVALWVAEQEWIEMRLRAVREVRAQVRDLDLEVTFAAGDDLRTEVSSKFRREALTAELRAAGFAPAGWWTDTDGLFSLSLWQAA